MTKLRFYKISWRNSGMLMLMESSPSTYVVDDFNGLKWTGFLAKDICFAFNNIRIVCSMEKTPIIDCITHLLLMMLHSELLPYRTLSYSVYRCNDIFSKSYFYFINHRWKLFHVFKKKVRNISRFDWDRQSRMRDYHLSIHALWKDENWTSTCFSDLHRRNYWPVN